MGLFLANPAGTVGLLGWLGAKGNEKEVIGNMVWAAVSWLMRLQSCRLLSQGMQCQGNEGSGINLSPQGSRSPHPDSISLIFVESEDRFY